MPAVTVPDNLTLDRIAPLGADQSVRAVRSVTDAPSGFEGEGFPVRRAFAGVSVADLDPFIHMDQMGEVEYAPGEPKGTPWHPHRGFETVTYMIDGTFQHQDSIGGGGLITNGSTQWMTAGAGILHIERPPEQLIASGGLFHGIQLWVNLPAAEKMVIPRYQDLEANDNVLVTSPDGGALVRVIAGDVAGHSGPGSTHTPISLVHAIVAAGRRLVLPWPKDYNALVYVLAGDGTVGTERGRSTRASSWSTAPVMPSCSARMESKNPATPSWMCSILGGRPIGEPVVAHGPFVMNSRAESSRPSRIRSRQARHGAGGPHRQRIGGAIAAVMVTSDIGDLSGRVALVTGANSGIGIRDCAGLGAPWGPRGPRVSQPRSEDRAEHHHTSAR